MGVIQEAYGLLVAHYVVRAVMTDAAQTVALPPSRMSFTNTLRIIREMAPEAQRTASADYLRLYRQLLSDVSRGPRPREAIAAILASSNGRCPSLGSKTRAIVSGLNRPNPFAKRLFSLSKPYCL